jgi:hypothetical protein
MRKQDRYEWHDYSPLVRVHALADFQPSQEWKYNLSLAAMPELRAANSWRGSAIHGLCFGEGPHALPRTT